METQIPQKAKGRPSEFIKPIIPLTRPEKAELDPLQYIDYMCHNTPGDSSSGKYDVDWEATKKRKQDLINKGNEREDKNCKTHTYQTGDKVLLRNAWKTKFNQNAYLGPYVITAVRDNGNVRSHKGRITDTFTIRNLTPYNE